MRKLTAIATISLLVAACGSDPAKVPQTPAAVTPPPPMPAANTVASNS